MITHVLPATPLSGGRGGGSGAGGGGTAVRVVAESGPGTKGALKPTQLPAAAHAAWKLGSEAPRKLHICAVKGWCERPDQHGAHAHTHKRTQRVTDSPGS